MREERAILGRIEPLVRGIALVIWAFCGLTRFDGAPHLWLVPWLTYGVVMVVEGFRGRLPRGVNVALLALQSVSVLALPRTGLVGFEGMLLSFVVVQLPAVISMRASILWAIAHVPLLWPIVWPFNNLTQMMELTGAYSGFSTFALLVHWVLARERKARAELARSNVSLLATRALVVEGSRQAERLRISRELHDSLGHHLTALKLQLELAQRQASAPPPALEKAKEIAQASLAEVRKVVSAMQAEQGVELVPALKALAAGVPSPRIEISAPDTLDLGAFGSGSAGTGELSHALFRCTQEAITNAVKHASARHVWVDIARDDAALRITVRDDGAGAGVVKAGNGLNGMKQRISELGGDVQFVSSPGFTVKLSVPVRAVS